MIDLSADRFDLWLSGVRPFDTIDGTPGADSLAGTDGDDLISGLAGADTLDGGRGADTLAGGADDDLLYGGKGHDSLIGGSGDDILHAASDELADGSSGDTLDGGGGGDTLFGSHQADSMDGGSGDDRISLYGGADTVHGGEGNDSISPSDAPPLTFSDGAQVYGEDGNDFIAMASSGDKGAASGLLDGGADHDLLQFRGLNNVGWTILGGEGDDQILALGRGDDTIDGGSGRDFLVYFRASKAVVVDLLAGTASGANIGQDTLIGIEGVHSGRGADSLSGDGGDNGLYGHGGEDAIVGGAGDDVLNGGGNADILTGNAGSDTLDGGGGTDTFVYYNVAESTGTDPDQIVGLKKHDLIDLSGVDADANTAGDQAFVRVSAFTGHAGELVLSYDLGGDRTLAAADVDGDRSADMVIELIGNHLNDAHFVL